MEPNKEVLENQQDKQKLGEEELKEVSGGGNSIGDLQYSYSLDGTVYLHTTEQYFFGKCRHAGNLIICNNINCSSHGTPLCVRGYHYTGRYGEPTSSKIYLKDYPHKVNNYEPIVYVEGVR